jgi:hypothetical protein
LVNIVVEPEVVYQGPQAAVASLTGSPLWGLSIDQVIAAAEARGWRHQLSARLPTPYGLAPLLVHFITASGRSVIWIPSYGNVRGEDDQYHHNHLKAFWLLWQAGVKVLLVGGTSGIADWRQGEDAVRPGDVVLPWSFRTKPDHRGLPGTRYETFWPDHDLLLDDPFCPALAQPLADRFRQFVNEGKLRRVHTPREVRVALVVPDSLTFETDFDILMWLSISKMSSELQPNRPPVATLHGDCMNPILARHLGMHLLYYHLVSNYAQGLAEHHDIADSIYDLYTETFPQVALEIELSTLESVEPPVAGACRCLSSVHTAPEVFQRAMTNAG